MKSKMNTWQKAGIVAVVTPFLWLFIVKAVDVSRAPEQLRVLSTETKEGFKQVNNRLDYFIGSNVTNDNSTVGKN